MNLFIDDSQELVERIRKSQEDEMTEDAPNDGIFPSSSVQQVDFSMRRKQKMPSRSEVVFNSAGLLSEMFWWIFFCCGVEIVLLYLAYCSK